ncbi:Endonuclease/exonuclease/phosphatase [Podospora appendiculata]|uniref:Endonuclease/exonuclease/phosphatase n=1 Tax=Podospora appendiculata TaxID=314037 RepID=A0AAE0X408_9PEZI|nr:Endonuclease/exonuclease/phosphatase [Podospora appendiculata]KAK3684271.1 Endonuclease/exonuclease/phosphatase [Podospora appendiculata]
MGARKGTSALDCWLVISQLTAVLPVPHDETSTMPISFSILSWNIDFMRPLADERMKVALAHLRSLVERAATRPSIIMLNEMVDPDFDLIQMEDWIRQGYRITDSSTQHWQSDYGTLILIPKSMPIKSVFRVHYSQTRMGRDALFVDISLPQDKTLRICTTHLESLVANPPVRPGQLAEAAKFIHEADASILGGDLNAIQPFDKTLHLENGLRDAYLETGGEEDAEAGMTWGQMAGTYQRNKFGLTRMDKLLFCGGLEVESFETFGMDLEVEDEVGREQLRALVGMEKGWITDHLGVKADFRVVFSD